MSSGWDYLIGNSETAYNKVASVVMGLKEVILEEKERKKQEKTDWKLIALRVLANLLYGSFKNMDYLMINVSLAVCSSCWERLLMLSSS